MEPIFAVVIGLMFAITVFLLLSRSYVRIILGIFMISNATNLLIFTAGRLTLEVPPLIPHHDEIIHEAIANPLPQALILTAIVISFALFSFILILTYRTYQEVGTVDVDEMNASEPRAKLRAPRENAEEGE